METLTSPDVTVYLHCAFLLSKMGMAGRVLRDPLLHPRVGSQPARTSVDTALSFQETWDFVTHWPWLSLLLLLLSVILLRVWSSVIIRVLSLTHLEIPVLLLIMCMVCFYWILSPFSTYYCSFPLQPCKILAIVLTQNPPENDAQRHNQHP